MNFYQELDLESILQCPVCMELPPGIIYMCKIGHHMCVKCRRRLTTCPSCQSAIASSRNFLAEALISKLSIFKDGNGDISFESQMNLRNADEKQLEKKLAVKPVMRDNPDGLKALQLPEGVFICLLESCPNREGMGVGNMFTHIDRLHPHLFQKFQNKTATFEHNFDDFYYKRSKHKYSRVLHVSNMGLFFLLVQFTVDHYMSCWIQSPAPVHKTNRFDYGLEFVKKDCDENDIRTGLLFTDKVPSNFQTRNWLLERGRVFIIPEKKHHLKDGSRFSLYLKIVYNMPPL